MASRQIIPKSFQLGGHTIDVNYRDDLISDQSALGRAKFIESLIEIQTMCEGVKISKSMQKQTFVHELVHHILYIMGSDLYADEKHTDSFSQYLYQYLESARYK